MCGTLTSRTACRGKYAKNIGDLKEPENKEQALQCLNEMVTNAMAHINDCLDYMMLLTHPNVFKFCGLPQAMAIATLARIYNNYDVFKREVKIRKGEAVQIMMYGGDYETIISYFVQYIKEVRAPLAARACFLCRVRTHSGRGLTLSFLRVSYAVGGQDPRA